MSQRKRVRKEQRREARSVQRVLRSQGDMARLAAVRMALREPVFDLQLKDAIAWAEVSVSVRSVDQIRDLALGVLRSLGVSTDGIDLKVSWYPADRRLDIRAVFTMATAERAIAKAKERRAPV